MKNMYSAKRWKKKNTRNNNHIRQLSATFSYHHSTLMKHGLWIRVWLTSDDPYRSSNLKSLVKKRGTSHESSMNTYYSVLLLRTGIILYDEKNATKTPFTYSTIYT